MKKQLISFVIPLLNEYETIEALFSQISQVMASQEADFEVIFVDDGSTDNSWEIISGLIKTYPGKVKGIKLRRNFGKAQALSLGFAQAKGDLVFTMDADLQDDPQEIPNFLKKLDEGYDLISGWKKKRHDPLSKTLPSKLFNAVARRMSGVKLNDFNCGFKVYRAEVLKTIRLYGELHRYIPILADQQGFRVGELAVQHHPRKFGQSKYGWERYMRGFLDLLTVIVTTKYLHKPGHFFGGIGIVSGFLGFGILAYLAALWFMGLGPIGHRPLIFLGIMLSIMSVQFISLGLIAELLVHKSSPQESELIVSRKEGF